MYTYHYQADVIYDGNKEHTQFIHSSSPMDIKDIKSWLVGQLQEQVEGFKLKEVWELENNGDDKLIPIKMKRKMYPLDDTDKKPKEASILFHNIMSASVKGNPKPVKKSIKKS